MMNTVKHTSILAVMLVITQYGYSQTIDHWETVVFANDIWQYKTGEAEPPAAWRSLDFDDSAWLQGRGGFGYGDGDDATQISPTISFYLRSTFRIQDISAIRSVLFHMDYDDAFVAWINDQEIARSAGLTSPHPPFRQTSSESHEAVMYNGGLPQAFNVSPSVLRQGENILAIQVHNQSSGSSDMSALPFLSVGLSTANSTYQPTPSWFVAPFEFTSSNIPIVVIDTQGKTIRNEPKIMARMGIIANKNGRNNIADAFNEYDSWIGIEKRGNASQNYDIVQGKWSYTIETRNEDRSNNNVKLLGMPKDNDWILSADFIDKTLVRNALAYYMSRSIGRWAPRTRHVELVVNGKYEGVYILVEKIKPDNNRVDIAKLDSSQISGEAVTGGYIWDIQQADATDIDFGKRRVLKYPKPDRVQPEQLAYIRTYDDEFRSIFSRSYYDDPIRGYPKYMDVSSFIDEIIIQEITKNSDAYSWSGFFHKKRSGKIFAGPVWDFDQSLSNSTFRDGDLVEMWIIENDDGLHPPCWSKLWRTPAFKQHLANTWFSYRNGPLKTERLYAFVDSLTVYLDEAQARNFTRWPILGKIIWRSTPGAQNRNSYKKEVDYMKEYVLEHAEWMDEQLEPFTSVHSAENKSMPSSFSFSLSPNPVKSAATLSYNLNHNGLCAVACQRRAGARCARFSMERQKRDRPPSWSGHLFS